jgi:hypothetical protein
MLAKRTVIPLALALGVTIVAVIGISATAFLSTNGGPATIDVEVAGLRAKVFDIIALPLYLLAMTTLPGAITYVLTRRDFPAWGAALATAGCVILVALGAWIGFVFAFIAFFGAPIVYLAMRHLVRARPALTLAVSTLALIGGLGLAAVMMSRALTGMG